MQRNIWLSENFKLDFFHASIKEIVSSSVKMKMNNCTSQKSNSFYQLAPLSRLSSSSCSCQRRRLYLFFGMLTQEPAPHVFLELLFNLSFQFSRHSSKVSLLKWIPRFHSWHNVLSTPCSFRTIKGLWNGSKSWANSVWGPQNLIRLRKPTCCYLETKIDPIVSVFY